MFLDKITKSIFLLRLNHEQINEGQPVDYSRCHRV